MEEQLYFAYGSNMSSNRLVQRVPSAVSLGACRVMGYRLAWHKKGNDGSGKCDMQAGDPGDILYGVLYSIHASHRSRLDRAEGLGRGYEPREVEAQLLENDELAKAFTYYATRTDPFYLPYDWYRDHVLIGAREHGLPQTYIHLIENVPTFEDPDRQRERAERAVHGPAHR